jgi:hypothetical protein
VIKNLHVPCFQIGSNWAVTAAHCVIDYYDDDDDDDDTEDTKDLLVVPSAELALLLGVHDKSLPASLSPTGGRWPSARSSYMMVTI